jgi:hypothetical protein
VASLRFLLFVLFVLSFEFWVIGDNVNVGNIGSASEYGSHGETRELVGHRSHELGTSWVARRNLP